MVRSLLVRLGHWLVDRYSPQPTLPLSSTVPRFQVVTTHYRGDSGGDALRAWEQAKRNRMVGDASASVFMDGDACRGRLPEEN